MSIMQRRITFVAANGRRECFRCGQADHKPVKGTLVKWVKEHKYCDLQGVEAPPPEQAAPELKGALKDAEYAGRSEFQLPPIRVCVPAFTLGQLCDAYSSDRIAAVVPGTYGQGVIVKAAAYKSVLYTCGRHARGEFAVCHRMLPLAEFEGDTTTYAEAARLPVFSYHGIKVRFKQKEYVLVEPAVRFEVETEDDEQDGDPFSDN